MRWLIAIALALIACGTLAQPTPSAGVSRQPTPSGTAMQGRTLSAAEAERLVGARVATALDALRRRDGAGLAALAHATKGVRFSPYPNVQTARDVVLMRSSLTNAYSDATRRTWGVGDGNGFPITLTFAEYAAQYIWTRDFLAASKTAYNKPIGAGNSIDNTAAVYPNAILFEAYDPGPDASMESLQWQSIRLLFEQDAGGWYLVGIVHGQWTI